MGHKPKTKRSRFYYDGFFSVAKKEIDNTYPSEQKKYTLKWRKSNFLFRESTVVTHIYMCVRDVVSSLLNKVMGSHI